MSSWYVDTSAIVKLVVVEDETPALRGWRATVTSDALVTCELAVTEVLRAVWCAGGDVDLAQTIVDGLRHVVVDRDLLLAAGRLPPPVLRTLDALHLAAASAFGDELAGIVTYDTRLADAARALGLPVLAPGDLNPVTGRPIAPAVFHRLGSRTCEAGPPREGRARSAVLVERFASGAPGSP